MKVQQITQSNINRKNPTFQKGLPAWYTKKTFSWLPEETQAIMKGMGVNAEFKDKLAVAASCLTTAELFRYLKLPLPANFSFEPLENKKVGGEYDCETDTVFINSDQELFTAPVSQDFHETMTAGSPVTKYFLHTYIHEFMHSAHFKNVNNIENYKKMRKYAPTDLLVEPVNALVKKFTPSVLDDKVDNKYPKQFGYYAYKNLNEFVAERGAYLISKEAMSNLMVDEPKDDTKYTFINPKGEALFEFDKEKDESKLTKFVEFLFDRQKCLKAIWAGDIDTITSKENRKFIEKIYA